MTNELPTIIFAKKIKNSPTCISKDLQEIFALIFYAGLFFYQVLCSYYTYYYTV